MRGFGWCVSERRNGAMYGRAWETMKWLTLNNSAMRVRGLFNVSGAVEKDTEERRSVAADSGGEMSKGVVFHGTVAPEGSLQRRVTGAYRGVEVAFDASAADQII